MALTQLFIFIAVSSCLILQGRAGPVRCFVCDGCSNLYKGSTLSETGCDYCEVVAELNKPPSRMCRTGKAPKKTCNTRVLDSRVYTSCVCFENDCNTDARPVIVLIEGDVCVGQSFESVDAATSVIFGERAELVKELFDVSKFIDGPGEYITEYYKSLCFTKLSEFSDALRKAGQHTQYSSALKQMESAFKTLKSKACTDSSFEFLAASMNRAFNLRDVKNMFSIARRYKSHRHDIEQNFLKLSRTEAFISLMATPGEYLAQTQKTFYDGIMRIKQRVKESAEDLKRLSKRLEDLSRSEGFSKLSEVFKHTELAAKSYNAKNAEILMSLFNEMKEIMNMAINHLDRINNNELPALIKDTFSSLDSFFHKWDALHGDLTKFSLSVSENAGILAEIPQSLSRTMNSINVQSLLDELREIDPTLTKYYREIIEAEKEVTKNFMVTVNGTVDSLRSISREASFDQFLDDAANLHPLFSAIAKIYFEDMAVEDVKTNAETFRNILDHLIEIVNSDLFANQVALFEKVMGTSVGKNMPLASFLVKLRKNVRGFETNLLNWHKGFLPTVLSHLSRLPSLRKQLNISHFDTVFDVVVKKSTHSLNGYLNALDEARQLNFTYVGLAVNKIKHYLSSLGRKKRSIDELESEFEKMYKEVPRFYSELETDALDALKKYQQGGSMCSFTFASVISYAPSMHVLQVIPLYLAIVLSTFGFGFFI